MKEKIVVIGGGGHAKVIVNEIKKLDNYEILGYTDLINNGLILGIKYLGNDEVLPEIIKKHKNCKAVMGIGYLKINDNRLKLYTKLKEIGFNLPPIISKNAIVNEEVFIGEGTFVGEGVIINNSSIIGKGSIINTGAIVEHDCILGEFVHISPGAILGGGVKIGNNSLIGLGTHIIHYKSIGCNCLIGAGSVVVKDILEEGIYVGTPVRKIK